MRLGCAHKEQLIHGGAWSVQKAIFSERSPRGLLQKGKSAGTATIF